MKTLIISDTHLTHRFNQDTFDILKTLFTKADRVVLNGDFWDSHLTTFDKFVNSKWKELFPILKAKKTIYIYGNHDEEEVCDERVNLFSVEQGYSYTLKTPKEKFYLTHGQEVVPHINLVHKIVDRFPILRPPARLILNSIIAVVGKRYFRLYKKMNEDMKAWAKSNLKEEILICGHSHLVESDVINKFINLGSNRHGYFQYMLLNKDGSWELKE